MRQSQYVVAAAIAVVVCTGGYLVYSANTSTPARASPTSDDIERLTPMLSNIDVWHDRVRHVTCWGDDHGFSCIPDWQLTPPDGGAR